MELRTPFSCRDIEADKLRKKKELCQMLLSVFERFGFKEVSTPAMEYYQTYNQAFSSLEDRQMVKLFDQNQEIVTLRMDMTVPIARLAATTLKNVKPPLRLSYQSNVWKLRKAYSGKPIETTDCGVELVGSSDDYSVLVCAIEALNACHLPNWRLELSDARLLEEAAKTVFTNEEDIERLINLCDKKSMVELREFLEMFDFDQKIKDFFLNLPLLEGGFDVLEMARTLAFNQQINEIIDQLEQTGNVLRDLGYGDQIGFDLGKLPHLNYYTGILFEAFVPGASQAILTGGRYDRLMSTFKRDMPSIGFAFKIDPLLELLKEKPKRKVYTLSYGPDQRIEAFKQARKIQKENIVRLQETEKNTEIILEEEVDQ